jgi:hypothetical protein
VEEGRVFTHCIPDPQPAGGRILVIVYIAFPPHLKRLVVSHNTHTSLGVSLTRNLPLSQLSLSNSNNGYLHLP